MASASAMASLLHHPQPRRPATSPPHFFSSTYGAPSLSGSPPVFPSLCSAAAAASSTVVPPKTLPFWVSRRNPGCRISLVFSSATALSPGMKVRRACELCDGEAVVHCEPDSAYLCRACDVHVHGANFLVARHTRRLLCRECGVLDPDQRPASGLGFPASCFVCRSCNAAYRGDGEGEGEGGDSDLDSDSESASSSCCSSSLRSVATSSCLSNAGSEAAARSGGEIAAVSAGGVDGPIKAGCSGSSRATELSECADRRRRRRPAAGAARRELDARTEALVLSWCRRIGLDDARAPTAASHALVWGARRMMGAPFRVVAAAAVWFAARLCRAEAAAMGGRRGEGALLRRLEASAGVPAKLIVVAEARLATAMRRRHVADEAEGWAECS